jgi:hypothetical protein
MSQLSLTAPSTGGDTGWEGGLVVSGRSDGSRLVWAPAIFLVATLLRALGAP